jgi:hypothetical protein
MSKTPARKESQKSHRKQNEEKQHPQRHQRLDTDEPQVINLDVKEPYVVGHRPGATRSQDDHHSNAVTGSHHCLEAVALEKTMANPSS